MEIKNKTFKFRPNRACDGPGAPINDERADWAEIAVVAFAAEIFTAPKEQSVHDESVQDLLTDMMHLCDREKIDFSECLRMAAVNYEEER